MEDFIFYEGIPPLDFKFDYEISLFNLPEFRQLQGVEDWASFYVLQKNKKLILAGIHFHLSKDSASSPFNSPYGSVESTANLKPKVLFQFLKFIETSLYTKGIRKIMIKNPPSAYDPGIQVLLITFLLNLGYVIKDAEIASILMVDKPFTELGKGWEKRKRKQTQTKGLELKYHPADQVRIIYNFIRTCRDQKGYTSSISLKEMEKTVNAFPGRFLLTTVQENETMVAASISIQVKGHILYHFYSDHSASGNPTNPTVFLIRGLYEYALQNHFELLDLGTSSLGGHPNFGLLDFKAGFGAKSIPKFTFEKRLTDSSAL